MIAAWLERAREELTRRHLELCVQAVQLVADAAGCTPGTSEHLRRLEAARDAESEAYAMARGLDVLDRM